jgi:hypothetical protein
MASYEDLVSPQKLATLITRETLPLYLRRRRRVWALGDPPDKSTRFVNVVAVDAATYGASDAGLPSMSTMFVNVKRDLSGAWAAAASSTNVVSISRVVTTTGTCL